MLLWIKGVPSEIMPANLFGSVPKLIVRKTRIIQDSEAVEILL